MSPLSQFCTDQISQKEKEELDDLSTELELADEDEKVQYGTPASGGHINTPKITPWLMDMFPSF